MRNIIIGILIGLLATLALTGCGANLDNVSGSATLQGGQLSGSATIVTPLGTFILGPGSSPSPGAFPGPSPSPSLFPSPSPLDTPASPSPSPEGGL